MSSENINLTENQRNVLRALLTLNLKSTTDIAKIIGVSRSTLTFALDGKRSLSVEALKKLLSFFGLVDWFPDPNVAHFLRVGSNIEPLKAVGFLFDSGTIYYIKPFGKVDLDEPWTGLFLIHFNSYNGKGLLIVHRDRFRSGKGIVGYDSRLAKPITPDIFTNMAWAKNPEIVLRDEVVKKLEAPFYRHSAPSPSIKELRSLFNIHTEINWIYVRNEAERYGMSPNDVLNLISNSQSKERNHISS